MFLMLLQLLLQLLFTLMFLMLLLLHLLELLFMLLLLLLVLLVLLLELCLQVGDDLVHVGDLCPVLLLDVPHDRIVSLLLSLLAGHLLSEHGPFFVNFLELSPQLVGVFVLNVMSLSLL